MMTIRTAGKALMIQGDQVLLIKHKKDDIYYTLPGGGQAHNEFLPQCLKRECLEEVGCEVSVGDLAFVYEYVGDVEQHPVKGYHQIDMIYTCDIVSFISQPQEMDDTQIGHEWVKIQDLMTIVLYPMALRKKIIDHVNLTTQCLYFSNLQ